jgi:hypothetical protein
MKLPRLRFTLGQHIALVAVSAVLFSLLRTPVWPVIIAIVLVLPGFAIDRARGGPRILGAMLAGAIGFLAYGVALCTYLCFFRGLSLFDSPWPFVMILALGMAGLAWGSAVGFWVWIMFGLCGRAVRPGPMHDESIGPIVWRGLDERRLQQARAGGRPS